MLKQKWLIIKDKIFDYVKVNNPGFIVKHAISFVVGFVLSPLSWWNDLFVNVPLAWAFAWLPLRFVSMAVPVTRNQFLITLLIGYWLTNVAGMLMMHWSGKRLINKDAKIELGKDFLIACLYTLIVSIVFINNPGDLLTYLHIIPSWTI